MLPTATPISAVSAFRRKFRPWSQGAAAFVSLLAVTPAPARAELPPLIPRQVLFGNAAKATPHLSPDGTRLAYLANSDKGVSNVWVQTLGKDDARMVTREKHRGVYNYQWAPDGRHLLYRQDADGDENWHVFSSNLDTGLVRDLTPFQGVRAQDLLTSPKHPTQILVGLNIRDRRVSDMYRIDLTTGAVTLEAQNPGDVLSWTTGADFVIRAATAFGGDSAQTTIRVRDNAGSPWRDLLTIPFERSSIYGQVNGGSLVASFSTDGKGLWVVTAGGANTTRLIEVDLKTGQEIRSLASDPRADVEYEVISSALFRPMVLTDPATGSLQAVAFNYTKLEWKATDPAIQPDLDTLRGVNPGEVQVIDRVRGDSLWLVQVSSPTDPGTYFLYDRPAKEASLLFAAQPELSKYALAPCEPVIVKARDGLDLVCYLTTPVGLPRKGLPLLLYPHGGPWWRDRWEFDPMAQLAANRGYAVLQVEYRGSIGFGLKHLNAGNRQFGDQGVLADLLDAVRWAVDSGLADPKRLGVMGGSAGGYLTLCCVAFHPEVFACAVDIVGPSDGKTQLEVIPEYWKPVKRRWVLRFGDAEHDEELNRRISPLYHAKAIRTPLLIGHGLNDPRVHIAESNQIVKALRENQRPVTLVVYPDEGHGFTRPENNQDFFGRMEEFLAQYLGGRKEPWRKVPGSTAEVR
jgi:dipeptidyl aminopeptidase/acylaminoacyl peptidase